MRFGVGEGDGVYETDGGGGNEGKWIFLYFSFFFLDNLKVLRVIVVLLQSFVFGPIEELWLLDQCFLLGPLLIFCHWALYNTLIWILSFSVLNGLEKKLS